MKSAAIALTGCFTLIAVMGMGRFSLTPQLPVMINEGSLTLFSAGLLASMNYVGYLLGSIYVIGLRKRLALHLHVGLWATAAVTFFSFLSASLWFQCVCRFIAGVGGAWALIIVTAWTQAQLAQRNSPRLSAAVFSGPGAGIALTGLLAWLLAAHHASAAQSWQVYGGVALLIALLFIPLLPKSLADKAESQEDAQSAAATPRTLLVAYTLAGFGYIIPATFLSQLAHTLLPGSALSALFWPLFGLAAIAGVLMVIFFGMRVSSTRALAFALGLQGMGVASVIIWQNELGLITATLLTGGCFLAIMQLTMRRGRELHQGQVSRMVGVLTTGYASGQLAGPLVSALSVSLFHSLMPALAIAVGGLLFAAATILYSRRAVLAAE